MNTDVRQQNKEQAMGHYNLIPIEREQDLLLPPSLREWLPEQDLAWFIIDAAVQFPPHDQHQDYKFVLNSSIKFDNPSYDSYVFSYPELVKHKESDPEDAPYPLYKAVFPCWDNEPRKPGRGIIYTDSTPELYKRWLQTVCQWTFINHPPEERFAFINAWNEWREGAHLEPDRRFGYAYLQATMDVVKGLQ